MTDELEALLKEEQEEEEEIFQLLSTGSVRYAAYQKAGNRNGTAAEEAGSRSRAAAEEAGSRRIDAAGRDIAAIKRAVDIQTEENTGPGDTVEEVLPEETVLSALRRDAAAVKGMSAWGVGGKESSAQALYRVLVRNRRAVRYQRPTGSGKIPFVRETVQTVGGNKDILQLDRAFQRDARRYDGGFTWQ